ncbi:MAG: alkaline phosphatase family protein [Chloroflexi bacterium]|nr:alkaline phosphatase family protein [Chloroflexota bacterium]MBU1749602.1 alkaline phosphatase family protein [Chloroflexota bacterium]MBU1880265.1 alkaline phosphatase family protein [Chloroflexota bacterium]
MTNRKVLLIGLDGATWAFFKPLMDEGALPHLQAITEGGTWGPLASTNPPTTPPAWTTCVTGLNPGRHGIYDFRESPLKHPRRPLVTSRSAQGPKLWHHANRAGRRAGVLNVPITYPPEPVDAFMISGMMTPGQESAWSQPADLKDRLQAAIGEYVVNVDIPKYDVEHEDDANEFLDDIVQSFRKRRDAFFWLQSEYSPDFFMAVFIITDRIQHLFWKMMDPAFDDYGTDRGKRTRERIVAAYQEVDEMLGQIAQGLAGNTDLVLVSDHGFGGTRAWFNVNDWLADEGLLTSISAKALRWRLFNLAWKLDETALVRTVMPTPARRAIRKRIRQTRSSFKNDLEGVIDWEQTQAFFASIPAQGIFINEKRGGVGTATGCVDPADVPALQERIRDGLLALRDPGDGKPVVDQVWFRDEVYHGPETQYAPHVIFVARNYATLGRQLLGRGQVVESSLNLFNGFHRPDGIFAALGPSFQAGQYIDNAAIVDITPTILYDMGLPVPTDLDGRVLTEVFRPDVVAGMAAPAESLTTAQVAETVSRDDGYSADEAAEIEDRLRGLGYLE